MINMIFNFGFGDFWDTLYKLQKKTHDVGFNKIWLSGYAATQTDIRWWRSWATVFNEHTVPCQQLSYCGLAGFAVELLYIAHSYS
jgi:hypothetical protein